MNSQVNPSVDAQSSLLPPWEGIYAHFREVPTRGEGFNSAYWVEHSRQRTEDEMSRVPSDRSNIFQVDGQSAFLALIASVAVRRDQKLRIMDFGGGMGVGYFHLSRILAVPDSVEYTVVETPSICNVARLLFKNDRAIQFVTELPSQSRFDIVYLNSSLQYVEDYQHLIRQLAKYEPNYFLFVRLSAGDIATYATAQLNVRGSRIPYWFLNIKEVVSIMDSLGYSLAFKTLGQEDFNQENFPPTYRLGRPCNLMFRPTSSINKGREGTSRCQ
jgi:putative methyltransferase (TIGR04325 family)